MAAYTLTTDLIEKVEYEDRHLYDAILYRFTNIMSPHKLAVDKDETILKEYAKVTPPKGLEHDYASWLVKLTDYKKTVLEKTNADISEIVGDPIESFKCIAASYNGRCPIIVHTRGTCPIKCDCNNETTFSDKKVYVLDKDDAANELNNTTIIITNGANSPIITGNNNSYRKK